MKGLLYKDLLVINSYKKSFLLMLAVYTLMGYGNTSMASFSIFGTLIVAVMAVTSTFSYDELAKWDTFALTMPLSRNDIVKSKYVLTIILLGISFILSIFISILLTILNGTSLNINSLFEMLLSSSLGVTFILSIFLPLFYYFGVEKGRLYFMIVPVLIFLIFIGISYGVEFFHIDLSFLDTSLNYLDQISFIIIPIIMMILLFTSYKISCKVFSKREF